ncbi:MAG: antitoxin component YwqK of YwqJK toxin-antitoxin module [Bacteroidia bacterium]|jgi:antitoxin component YwqK of YwqJK toxin-antitoxin module
MKTILRTISLIFICAFAIAISANGQDLNQTDTKGLKQGKWEKRYTNGRVRYQGQFKDGEPYGLFQYFYDNSQLQATNKHIGDRNVANHVYHKNGKIKAKGLYREMKKDSLWQYFNDRELMVLEETYIMDTLHGAQKTYFENGKLGEETNYRKGVKHGVWKKSFDDGKPWVDASYEDGNLHGSFKMYQEKGKPKVQGDYHQGIRTGAWLKFNANGSVYTQDVYRHGVLKTTKRENGEFKEYYESGIPKSVYKYRKGNKEGEFKIFYDTGEFLLVPVPGKMGGADEIVEQLVDTKVKTKGWYHLDQLNGKVTHFNEDASTLRVEVWENGTLVSTIDWEEKGNE